MFSVDALYRRCSAGTCWHETSASSYLQGCTEKGKLKAQIELFLPSVFSLCYLFHKENFPLSLSGIMYSKIPVPQELQGIFCSLLDGCIGEEEATAREKRLHHYGAELLLGHPFSD